MKVEVRRSLFASSLVCLERVRCRRAHRGVSGEERKPQHQIMVPLSGVNVRHVNGKSLTVSPSRVTLSNRGEPYRVSHPYGSGETALTIVLREDVLLGILRESDPSVEQRPDLPFSERQVPMDSKLHFAIQLLSSAIAQMRPEFELEEAAILLAQRVLDRRARHASSPRDLDIAEQARAFIAARLDRPIRLQDVADVVDLSVFQLCRAFRRATGHTLWREVQQLRVRAALERLAAGERDLSALAIALGFAHHSHFTATVHRELGITPSAARRLLDTGSMAQVRRLLAR